jgi:general secretion pathway protein G
MSEGFCPRCSRPLDPGATRCVCGAEVKPAGSGKWVIYTVIGCGCALVGVAVLGIVAALVIPNFLDALQKAKQKRTLADMRAFSVALESYRADQGHYPDGADAEAVRAELSAHGLALENALDGWKNALRWSCLEGDGEGCLAYELASSGRDGVFASQPGEYEQGAFPLTEYDQDLVLADGLFTRWPEGQGRFAPGG